MDRLGVGFGNNWESGEVGLELRVRIEESFFLRDKG